MLNSKGEFNRCRINRLVIEGGEEGRPILETMEATKTDWEERKGAERLEGEQKYSEKRKKVGRTQKGRPKKRQGGGEQPIRKKRRKFNLLGAWGEEGRELGSWEYLAWETTPQQPIEALETPPKPQRASRKRSSKSAGLKAPQKELPKNFYFGQITPGGGSMGEGKDQPKKLGTRGDRPLAIEWDCWRLGLMPVEDKRGENLEQGMGGKNTQILRPPHPPPRSKRNTTTPPQDGSKSSKNSENRHEKVENNNIGRKYDVVKSVCDLHGCAVGEIKRKKTSWVQKKSGLFGRQKNLSVLSL